MRPQVYNRPLFTGDNLHLLCACNHTKGTDTMADLMARLAAQVGSQALPQI